jgi:ADP-heptose:LPS heptosyltransferase
MHSKIEARTNPHASLIAEADEPLSSLDLSRFILSILDEFDAADFRNVERLIAAFKRQALNPTGFPRIRPPDCSRVTEALVRVAKSHEPLMGDQIIAQRIDDLFSTFAETDVSFYPDELFKVKVFQASTRLTAGNVAGALEIIEQYSSREYLVEGDWLARMEYARLDGLLRLFRGDDTFPFLCMRRAAKIAYISPPNAAAIFNQLASLIALAPRRVFKGRAAAQVVWLFSRIYLAASRGAGSLHRNWLLLTLEKFATLCGSLGLLLVEPNMLRRMSPEKSRRSKRQKILVTRAMGGIGDLLMLTPALRAQSIKNCEPVSLAVPRRFFPIFEGNKHVKLFDIEGPAIELDQFDRWHDLTLCPAGRYESVRRPNVRMGRVELFARSLGVKKRELNRHGWKPEVHLGEQQRCFAKDFISAHFRGDRPILGFQPYSRDSYKDLPDCFAFIRQLAKTYDIILFHHRDVAGLTTDKVVSTAGLSLSESLALVQQLNAMLCVDSAMLHAAAAFDIPVVAMFGPTPGHLFTRHHNHAALPQPARSFSCRPCWRNEDMKCLITGKTGHSACMRAFNPYEIATVVQQVIEQTSTE